MELIQGIFVQVHMFYRQSDNLSEGFWAFKSHKVTIHVYIRYAADIKILEACNYSHTFKSRINISV